MRSVVVGGGELGTAITLSLLANQRRCELRLRDEVTVANIVEARAINKFRPPITFPLPMNPNAVKRSVFNVHRLDNLSVAAPTSALFVCCPASALYDNESNAEGCKSSLLKNVEELYAKICAANSLSTCESQERGKAVDDSQGLPKDYVPPVILLCRGLTSDGRTPAQLLRERFNAKGVSCPVMSGCVAAVPRDWAEHSAKALSALHWFDGSNGDEGATSTEPAVHLSPAGMIFGASHAGASFQHRSVVGGLFRRETVDWIETHFQANSSADFSDLLGIINAAVQIVAFGAGMVSNEYPGSLTSIQGYFLHASTSLSSLIASYLAYCSKGQLEGPPAAGGGTPSQGGDALDRFLKQKRNNSVAGCQQSSTMLLPPSMQALLFGACVNQSSREYLLGRRMKFYAVPKDALNSTYGGLQCPHRRSLEHTFDGFHVLLKAMNHTNNFFEGIIDAFTVYRSADAIGRNLVKTGYYPWLDDEGDVCQPEHPLTRHVAALDKAVELGEGLEESVRDAVSDLGSFDDVKLK